MKEQGNLLFAIVLSLLILLGFQYFFEAPKMKKEAERKKLEQTENLNNNSINKEDDISGYLEINEALNKGMIFGAGLDVFEKEPPNPNNPLLKNKKVLLSPHSATFTEECNERMSKETIQNIIDFFENKLDKTKIVKL